jgi:DNA-binding CsgD family transcriptional regulator
MSAEQFDKIIERLDTLSRLLAINVLKEMSQTERISLLVDFGFENKSIANLLGIKENIVRATKSNIAKTAKKPKAEKKTKSKKDEETEKKTKN